MGISRRQFLTRVGTVSGYGVAFTMAQQLGLMPVPGAAAQERAASPVAGNGTRVVILGGGIAGLVSAWELGKAGYHCTVLEARTRAGGRNWSVRDGAKVNFEDGTEQTCAFEPGLYMNAGPARLPSIHTTMLGYCRELAVPLEVEINDSRCALMQAPQMNGGVPIQQRRMVNDARGHVSELLAKCVNNGALDAEVTADDKAHMLEFLQTYGDLKPDYKYEGSARSGYTRYPGASAAMPVVEPPLTMREMLAADLWRDMLASEVIDWQPTMFQPVGGMDRIPAAFEKALGKTVRFGAEVKTIRQDGKGVTVTYMDRATKQLHTITADYCICALPLTIVKGMDADFAPDVKSVIDAATYAHAYKVGWQSRRFWEQDYQIYGGLSYVKGTVDIVWYPSAGCFSPKGIVLGGYSVENNTAFGKLPSMQAKLDASRAAIETLHPGHGKELEKPVYVNWGQIPFNLGSWVSTGHDGHMAGYERIIEPDRRVYFAGDHTSEIVGWQEGAALSALRCMRQIGAAVQGGSSAA